MEPRAHEFMLTRREVRLARAAVASVLLLGHPEDVEDVAQEALLRAWERREAFNGGRSALTSWLWRIARHAAIDHLRAKRRQRAHEADVDASGTAVGGAGCARVALVQAARWMRKLPPEQLHALEMRIAGEPFAAVAREQGVKVETVRTRVRLAQARMAKAAA